MTKRIGVLTGMAMLLLPGTAHAQRERADVISLGSSAEGEPCVATRNWRDPAVPDPFAQSYVITCRSVVASRPLGIIRIVANTPAARAPIEAQFVCGPDRPVVLATGPARFRRCSDRGLGTETVRLDLVANDRLIVAAATPALLPQLEEGVAILSGAKPPSADTTRTVKASIELSAFGAIPASSASASAGDSALETLGFDPAIALSEGIDLNHKGLYIEASRLLNDALSRLPADIAPATRAELLLEVGLADSNIRFDDSASQRFDAADAIITELPSARAAFLVRKRDTYRALDLINRRRFRDALAVLDRLARSPAAERPLQDPATLRSLNQVAERRADAAGTIAVPGTAGLAQLALDAQLQWARSVVLLGLGDEPGSLAAIESAANTYRPLENERIEQGRILWLGARIARQQGRIRARAGRIGDALESFDRALDALRRSALANAGTGAEPAIAELQLERAGVFARGDAPVEAKRGEFSRAVDSVIAASGGARGATGGLEYYLDLLVREAATDVRPDTFELYFRALQAGGEPAVARQITRLQQVVIADPALGAAVRDRAELEREIVRLRYQISAGSAPAAPEAAVATLQQAATPPRVSQRQSIRGQRRPVRLTVAGSVAASVADGVRTADLERARDAAEQRLLAVDAKLLTNPRYRSVAEPPATIAELRAGLRPGEAFLKISQFNRGIYGLYVDAGQSFAYTVADGDAAKRAVMQLAADVRLSIDGRLDAGKLVPFDDAKAYALFRLIAGPAAEQLATVRTLVVDPGGPLERLPIGVLVTRFDRTLVRADPFDFSATSFLAGSATISTALSPRSFLVSRALPPSRAPKMFLGFGEHMPPPATPNAQPIRVGFGCMVEQSQLFALSRQLPPISRRELTIAADALGDPGAPTMTDAAFTDTAVIERRDLSEYAVLHFATHGLQEGQWGCAKSPPALVTSFGSPESDGLLSFSEIAGLHLDANLVVLSACDTSAGVRDQSLARMSGQEEAGSTLEGLVRAFLTANARSVLATNWQVSAEDESRLFMQSFYTATRTGSIGDALRIAQGTLMRQPAFSHPFYWGPYFLVGDGTKSLMSAATVTARR